MREASRRSTIGDGQKLADDLGSIQRSGHGQVGRSQNCAAYLVAGSSQSQSTTGTVPPWSPKLRQNLGTTYAQLRHILYTSTNCTTCAKLVHIFCTTCTQPPSTLHRISRAVCRLLLCNCQSPVQPWWLDAHFILPV